MRWPWTAWNLKAVGAPSPRLDGRSRPVPMSTLTPAVCASASKASKQTNEDAHAHFRGEHLAFVAIADGLGSSPDCHIASGLVIDSIDRYLRRLDRPDASLSMKDVTELWTTVAATIENFCQGNPRKYPEGSHPLETTLLFAVDLPENYVISYVGNGSVWLVRGDYWEFLPRRWPWCIADLLIGHSSFSPQGREVLYGTLGSIGLTSAPHTLFISKDQTCGEIIMLTTDGISSRDHARIGEDANHKLWQEVDPHIRVILENDVPPYLRTALAIGEEQRSVHLQSAIDHFLTPITFDDDATIGVLVADKVFHYFGQSNEPSKGVS